MATSEGVAKTRVCEAAVAVAAWMPVCLLSQWHLVELSGVRSNDPRRTFKLVLLASRHSGCVATASGLNEVLKASETYSDHE